jgi:hypothetical protein
MVVGNVYCVLEILSYMATRKKETRVLDGFEGLLRYCVNLTPT